MLKSILLILLIFSSFGCYADELLPRSLDLVLGVKYSREKVEEPFEKVGMPVHSETDQQGHYVVTVSRPGLPDKAIFRFKDSFLYSVEMLRSDQNHENFDLLRNGFNQNSPRYFLGEGVDGWDYSWSDPFTGFFLNNTVVSGAEMTTVKIIDKALSGQLDIAPENEGYFDSLFGGNREALPWGIGTVALGDTFSPGPGWETFLTKKLETTYIYSVKDEYEFKVFLDDNGDVKKIVFNLVGIDNRLMQDLRQYLVGNYKNYLQSETGNGSENSVTFLATDGQGKPYVLKKYADLTSLRLEIYYQVVHARGK